MAAKIAIIGGGSAYAPGLIQAFVEHAEDFQGVELALMDVAQPELEIVARLGRKLARAAGADIEITGTTDQRSAIRGASYVLTTFRQGGFHARHQDESIPLRHGVIGQETVGPGGFFFAMRTLPVIKEIIADMERLAPNALLLNYANPTQIVAEAVTHFSRIPCLSICDQSKDDQRTILAALGRPAANVTLESVGLNHATWSTKFIIDGDDGVDFMLRHIDDVLARPDVSARTKRQFQLARVYGRLPNSYLQYYYFREETVAEARAANQTRAEAILAELPSYFAHFEQQAAAERPVLSHVRGGSIFGDMAVDVLRDLIRQNGAIHTLNVPNQSAIADFEPDRIVEVPARIEQAGARPLVQGHLPSDVVGLLKMLADYQWLAAEAIWQGDRQALERALAANPLVLSLPLAQRMLDEILPLQRAYLPARFHAS